MVSFVIKPFESGFEKLHKKIDLEIIREWAWPFESFTELYDDPSFDPDTVLSCFKGDKMIGYVLAKISGEGPAILANEGMGAYLDIPRVLPNYNEASELLMEKIIEILKDKGAKLIRTRVSSMRENSIQLAKAFGFKPLKDYPLGYKIYYQYKLSKGKIDYPTKDLLHFNKQRDLEECAKKISYYFKMPLKRAKNWILEIDSQKEFVSHYVIRSQSKLEGYSIPCENSINKKIIASCFINASSEEYFKQLLVQNINDAVAKKYKTYLVDLIGDILVYEEVVKLLGFENAAIWGIYEKKLV